MILVGLNFSTKFTYITVIDQETKKQHQISFGETNGIRNTVYYKDRNLLTFREIMQE